MATPNRWTPFPSRGFVFVRLYRLAHDTTTQLMTRKWSVTMNIYTQQWKHTYMCRLQLYACIVYVTSRRQRNEMHGDVAANVVVVVVAAVTIVPAYRSNWNASAVCNCFRTYHRVPMIKCKWRWRWRRRQRLTSSMFMLTTRIARFHEFPSVYLRSICCSEILT